MSPSDMSPSEKIGYYGTFIALIVGAYMAFPSTVTSLFIYFTGFAMNCVKAAFGFFSLLLSFMH